MSHYEEVIIGSTSQMTEVKSKATRTVNSRIRIPAPYLPECPPPLSPFSQSEPHGLADLHWGQLLDKSIWGPTLESPERSEGSGMQRSNNLCLTNSPGHPEEGLSFWTHSPLST